MANFRTTDLERENLEAHVELSAERFTHLAGKVESIESATTDLDKKLTTVEKDLNKAIEQFNKDINKTFMGVAGAVIAGLASALFTYISK
jgi:predicted transcriptional regulator